jgi:hypothetical protein
MFKKIYDFMKVILMPILKAEFKFEYDAINLAKIISKEICLRFGENKEGGFQEIVKEFIDEIKCDIKNDLQENGSLDLLKKINLDCFSVDFFLPQCQSGLAIILKIPGLNEFISNCA